MCHKSTTAFHHPLARGFHALALALRLTAVDGSLRLSVGLRALLLAGEREREREERVSREKACGDDTGHTYEASSAAAAALRPSLGGRAHF